MFVFGKIGPNFDTRCILYRNIGKDVFPLLIIDKTIVLQSRKHSRLKCLKNNNEHIEIGFSIIIVIQSLIRVLILNNARLVASATPSLTILFRAFTFLSFHSPRPHLMSDTRSAWKRSSKKGRRTSPTYRSLPARASSAPMQNAVPGWGVAGKIV